MEAYLHPSILNCNIGALHHEIERIKNADMVHVDVMDNHFVPNLSWGLPVVEAVLSQGVLPVDAHLMINNPDHWAPQYAELGCASVTFHIEAAQAALRLSREIHRLGAKVGVALRPTTPLDSIESLLTEIDMVLVMTVEPGFGGQSYIPTMETKIRRLRNMICEENLSLGIQVDGGINSETICRAAEAGANIFVAGSAVFRAQDASKQVDLLKNLALSHAHA